MQSPKSDIFVALLGVALGAIVFASLLMFILLWRYDFKVNAKVAALDSAKTISVVSTSTATTPDLLA